MQILPKMKNLCIILTICLLNISFDNFGNAAFVPTFGNSLNILSRSRSRYTNHTHAIHSFSLQQERTRTHKQNNNISISRGPFDFFTPTIFPKFKIARIFQYPRSPPVTSLSSSASSQRCVAPYGGIRLIDSRTHAARDRAPETEPPCATSH